MTKFAAFAPSASDARCLVPAPRESLKLGAFSGANEDAERRSHETLPGLMGGIARGLIAHRYLLVSVRLIRSISRYLPRNYRGVKYIIPQIFAPDQLRLGKRVRDVGLSVPRIAIASVVERMRSRIRRQRIDVEDGERNHVTSPPEAAIQTSGPSGPALAVRVDDARRGAGRVGGEAAEDVAAIVDLPRVLRAGRDAHGVAVGAREGHRPGAGIDDQQGLELAACGDAGKARLREGASRLVVANADRSAGGPEKCGDRGNDGLVRDLDRTLLDRQRRRWEHVRISKKCLSRIYRHITANIINQTTRFY